MTVEACQTGTVAVCQIGNWHDPPEQAWPRIDPTCRVVWSTLRGIARAYEAHVRRGRLEDWHRVRARFERWAGEVGEVVSGSGPSWNPRRSSTWKSHGASLRVTIEYEHLHGRDFGYLMTVTLKGPLFVKLSAHPIEGGVQLGVLRTAVALRAGQRKILVQGSYATRSTLASWIELDLVEDELHLLSRWLVSLETKGDSATIVLQPLPEWHVLHAIIRSAELLLHTLPTDPGGEPTSIYCREPCT
jgi:hypothetical protein